MRRGLLNGVQAAALVLLTASVSFALGRKRDYREQTVYESQPVRYGSAANPNKAFSPPQFNDYNAAPEKSPSSRNSKQPQVKNSGAGSPTINSNTPSAKTETATPPPTAGGKPAASPSPDMGEPPLPDYTAEEPPATPAATPPASTETK